MQTNNNRTIYLFLPLVILMFFVCGCALNTPPKTNEKPPETLSQPGSDASNLAATPSDTPQKNPAEDALEIQTEEGKEIEINEIASASDSLAAQTERANELYEEAVKRWEEGDSDAALAAFDAAYVALTEIKATIDSPRSEEKNQLRLMIAQRIQEIHAAFASIGESSQFIALDENPHVMAEIKRFQTNERVYFMESVARSGLYQQMMTTKLKEAGLPEDLRWIPLIESGFKIRAYSKARALGLWQFIASTGHRYGLKKDKWVDERMDPEKATEAAVKYLKELHSYFGDWTTALAAYNCGEFRIQRLLRDQKVNYLDNFWDLYVRLPRETARFVPRFIATLLIIKDPKKYDMELPTPMPAVAYERLRTDSPFKLSQLSQSLSLAEENLADLNPELRHKSTPDTPYDLKIPQGSALTASQSLASLSKWIPSEVSTSVHTVRQGETVSLLARRYRTSIDAILRLNGLGKRHTLRLGQNLRIPDNSSPNIPSSNSSPRLVAVSVAQPKGTEPYTVKPGDTLYAIARQFQMSVDQLKSINGLSTRIKIFPGQKLWVQNGGGNG